MFVGVRIPLVALKEKRMFEVVALYPTRFHFGYQQDPTTKDIILFDDMDTVEEAENMKVFAATFFDLPIIALAVKEY